MNANDIRKIENRKSRIAKSDLSDPYALKPLGLTHDLLGISFFVFHLGACAYIVWGWVVPSTSALMFYLAFLPLVAMQWMVNQGSCVISNFETLLRLGRWRDPEATREGRFISMAAFRLFGLQTSPANMDVLSFGALFVLWLLGFFHLSARGDPALLSLFP